MDVLALGVNDITNDIALGLQLPLDVADEVTRGINNDHPKRKVEEIIHARVTDILELITRHLQKIKKNRLLPAGIIFTGGGSHIEYLNDYAKQELKLPSDLVSLERTSRKTKRTVRVPNQFSIAYGLCVSQSGHQRFNRGGISFKNMKRSVSYLLNQIMP